MAIETKEVVIGNSNFSINTYATGKSVNILTRLTKVFGEAIPTFFARVAESVDTEGMTKEQIEAIQAQGVMDAAKRAVGVLVSNLDKEDVAALLKDIVMSASTLKDNKPINYENDFSGSDISDLIQLVIFIVMENYGKVFRVSGIAG